MRSETKPSQDEEKNGQEPLLPPIQPVIDFGSVVIKNSRAAIHCLTIAGQIEGHMQLPNTQKATKYEHVLPLLAYLEESDDIDGVLFLLNTVGGDVEAGLAIAELLSGMLKRRGIRHEVLNAKYHEKEAGIIAQAGKFGAVTIATNMAGRGTDIMLGGNAEYLAKSDMRKQDFDEEEIDKATSYFETDDEAVLALRKTYADLLEKHKAEIAPEAEKVREDFTSSAPNATIPAVSTISSEDVPAVREIPAAAVSSFRLRTIL